MVNQIPRLLTPDEVAETLQVTPDAVRRWLRSGRIRGIYLGRVWRVHPDDLQAFMDAHARTGTQAAGGNA